MKLAQHNKLLLFPLKVYAFKIVDFEKQRLMDFVFNLQISQDPRQRSNRNGWQSYNNLHENNFTEKEDIESVSHLIEIITLGMQQVRKEWDFSCYNKNFEPKITALWVNINPYGGRNELHDHGNTGYSGVFYINKSRQINEGEVPIDDGHIEFEDTRKEAVCWQVPSEGGRVFGGSTLNDLYSGKAIPAETGDMLIFPSWASHRVHENLSNQVRVSASFNFNWYSNDRHRH